MAESTSAASEPRQPFDIERVTDAALRLAALRDWEQVSLLDIAKEADVSLVDLYKHAHTKQEILAAFTRRVDEAVLAERDAEAEGELGELARDRLFDALMLRFDHLQPYRDGLKSVLKTYRRDPVLAVGGLCDLRRSMACMLEAADLSSSGLRGRLRRDGLTGIYLATLRVWLEDGSPDMAKTMAALDGYLRRIERPVSVMEGLSAPRFSRAGRGDRAGRGPEEGPEADPVNAPPPL